MAENVFVDSSVFLSHVLNDRDSEWSRKKLARIKNDSRGNFEPFTSHVVLGEVKISIVEASENRYVQDLYERFLTYFDVDKYYLTTVGKEDYIDMLEEVRSIDERISYNDCRIVAEALAENCNKLYTTDRDWSKRFGIEVVGPE